MQVHIHCREPSRGVDQLDATDRPTFTELPALLRRHRRAVLVLDVIAILAFF